MCVWIHINTRESVHNFLCCSESLIHHWSHPFQVPWFIQLHWCFSKINYLGFNSWVSQSWQSCCQWCICLVTGQIRNIGNMKLKRLQALLLHVQKSWFSIRLFKSNRSYKCHSRNTSCIIRMWQILQKIFAAKWNVQKYYYRQGQKMVWYEKKKVFLTVDRSDPSKQCMNFKYKR